MQTFWIVDVFCFVLFFFFIILIQYIQDRAYQFLTILSGLRGVKSIEHHRVAQ